MIGNLGRRNTYWILGLTFDPSLRCRRTACGSAASQRSGASPLQPRVRREPVGETEHGRTIRLHKDAVQPAGACVGRKPLSRKGRTPLRRDLCRRRPGRNRSRMLVRARLRVVACPAPHISRESPNGWRLSGERSRAERVRCSRGLDGRCLQCMRRFHCRRYDLGNSRQDLLGLRLI
jgi:hypothetical protein